MNHRISGKEFKAIRELCGFSAAEVAAAMKQYNVGISTARSVYRLENREEIRIRQVNVLMEVVGTANYERALAEIRGTGLPPAAAGPAEETRRSHRSELRRHRAETDPEASSPESVERRFIGFINALPITANTLEWITQFRDALRMILVDVDRFSINVNLDCDLSNPYTYRGEWAITEYIDSAAERGTRSDLGAIATRDNDGAPSERILEGFRVHGFDFSSYHPPLVADYYLSETAYLGTLIAWRVIEQPPISDRTMRMLAELKPFILFALSDVVARHQTTKPFDRAFNDALDYMERDAGLTPQERRVISLQLYGHRYEDIARQANMSVDTVRKHIKSVYRKTHTHSSGELFAKYFTPRLGI